ncbi:Gustatory receptor 72b [Halyomorpha halys]|nr:Gustatory receptor 72b [Halyomorpha halys]
MQRHPSQTVESNIIFKTSSVLGIFPFRNINNKMKIDWFLLFYSFIVVAFILSLMFVYIATFSSLPRRLPTLVLFCLSIINHSMALICLLCLCLNHDLVTETFQCLNCLKLFFHEFGVDNSNKATEIRTLLDILIPIFMIIIQFNSGYRNFSIGETTISTFTSLIYCVSCGQFSFLVDTVGDMFHLATNLLKSSAFSKSFRNVKEIVELVNQLILTSDNINYMYSFQMFMIMSISFAYVIIHLFLFYHLIHWNEPLLKDIFGELLMMMVISFNIWRVNHSSSLTCYKSKEFNAVLYQIMLDEENKEIRQNNKLQLHISMNREVVFTAYGFFNLDHTLIYSMVASATTYVVILIQFGQPLEKPPKAAITNLTITPLPLSMTTSI